MSIFGGSLFGPVRSILPWWIPDFLFQYCQVDGLARHPHQPASLVACRCRNAFRHVRPWLPRGITRDLSLTTNRAVSLGAPWGALSGSTGE
ncbi:MAG: hypothetical protein OXC57_07040 [Rhodobacteraceae bacterium]|nr:hypothetical protein [Paracoccaceae bacterium]